MFQKVNGLEIFYEKTGSGPHSLILVHGNGEDHTIFDKIIAPLSQDFTIYAMDSRGHGQSGFSDQIGYEAMAADTIAFIQALELVKPVFYGFSDGGIIGLLVACTCPELLSRLMVSGANTTPQGVKPKWLLLFRIIHMLSRDKKISMLLSEPHITREMLQRITVPTLVLAGSRDMVRESDTRFIADSIDGNTLRILEGEGHMSYVIHSPKLMPIIQAFIQDNPL
ncbi:MAG: alpha/beta fold hydrolase [Sphaerochaetaceae bacterium]